MFPNKVSFKTEERKNVCTRKGKEWALYAKLSNDYWFVIKTWETKPSPEVVKEVNEIAKRCFELYHRNLRVPFFEIEDISNK